MSLIAEFRAYHWARYGATLPIEGQTLEALQVIELEKAWEGHVPCEHDHTKSKCSVEVVALVLTCNPPMRACAVSAKIHEDARLDLEARCSDCQELVADCWRVIPFG
jgi:hypothetical protein